MARKASHTDGASTALLILGAVALVGVIIYNDRQSLAEAVLTDAVYEKIS